MSEINNADLNEIIENMDLVEDGKEVNIPLFQDMKVETPFQSRASEVRPSFAPVRNTSVAADVEHTTIGSSTVLDSNISCGGDMDVRGQINGNVTVAGNLEVISGSIEGDVEADSITVCEGARIVGNIHCNVDATITGGSSVTGDITVKNELNVTNNSSVVGNTSSKNAFIDSSVKGNVEVINELKLSGTSSILGDITTGSISVSSGSVINGKIAIKR